MYTLLIEEKARKALKKLPAEIRSKIKSINFETEGKSPPVWLQKVKESKLL